MTLSTSWNRAPPIQVDAVSGTRASFDDVAPSLAQRRRFAKIVRLAPQRVDVVHGGATQRQSHLVVEQPGDAGKAGEGLSRLLRRHVA